MEGLSETEDIAIEEDALYDPRLDPKDARWVRGIRGRRKSDAILSCPCCFTTVCVDCQQHSSIPTRFRAMFVMNSRVDLKEKRYPYKAPKRGKRKLSLKESNAEEECFAVFCAVCNVEIAVFDNEGVYHFFNVLPSTA